MALVAALGAVSSHALSWGNFPPIHKPQGEVKAQPALTAPGRFISGFPHFSPAFSYLSWICACVAVAGAALGRSS